MNIFKSTALYGKSFEATDKSGAFTLRVYTGGFAGVDTATQRVTEEAQNFLTKFGYSEFRILESKRVWLPFSCVDFLVTFLANQNKEAEQAVASDGDSAPV